MPDQPRPNVIWIFGDQQRGQALGWMGDPNLATPNLDRMCEEGVCSTGAVSGFPLCCPFRGSLLTGRYPHQCVPGHEFQMPPDQPTIASAFRQAGYTTAYYGKWHVDGFKERPGQRAVMHIVPPERRGDFDEWCGYENNNSQWDTWVHGGEGQKAFHYRLPGFETDALTDLLINYIQRQAGSDRPFFAVLSVQPPHDPYLAPESWMQRRNPGQISLRANVPPIQRVQERARRSLAGYYAAIENLDWNVGRVRQALAEAGLDLHTHLIFFSDHGDMHGSHGQFHKTSPYEESLRIPFIMGGAESHYALRQGTLPILVNHVDFAPTTLGLCGIAPPDWMQGTNYASYRLRGSPPANEPDSAYLQLVVPTMHYESVDRPYRGVVTKDGWKYVALEGQPWLLFNLNEDPYELANQALNPRYQVQRRRLQERLAAWIHDTGDHFNLPEI